MNRENMKDFLSDLIEVYPGYKAKILNQDAFVDNWMSVYGNEPEEKMREAATIYTDKGRFFPTTDEFKMSLLIAEFRHNQREQQKYEREHPTSAEDQARIDSIINDIFGGETE